MLVTILTLAWPTMLEQLMQTAVQYVDTAMVGSLGTEATAAVGATSTVNWLLSSTIAALGVGFLAMIAQALGADDKRTARRAAGQTVLVTLVTGLFFTALTAAVSPWIPAWMQVEPGVQAMASRYFLILYLPMLPRAAMILFGTALRAAGDTRGPMKIGIVVNLVNVVLNFLLIYPTRVLDILGFRFTAFGADMGVEGAALASAVAFTVGGILITIRMWRNPSVSFRRQRIRPDMELLRPCLKTALPNMLQRFGTSLGYVAFAAMVNGIGQVATAANTIANTVESAFYIPGYGMQTAAATLAGNAYGARDRRRLWDTARMFIPIEIGLMVVSGAALFGVAPWLMGLFSQDKAVIELGSTVLRMVALSEPFFGFSIILEGLMLGVGKTKAPFVYNIVGMWGIRIVGTFICTELLGMGLVAAWACMIAHNLLLFALFLMAYQRKTWDPMNQ